MCVWYCCAIFLSPDDAVLYESPEVTIIIGDTSKSGS